MDVSEHVYTVFAWISGVILVLGVLLNGLVCTTFLICHSLFSKAENMFIFSMALSDLLCCATALPTSLISNLHHQWMFGESGCKGHAFVATWCGVVSITHLAALAYNRYETMTLREHRLLSVRRVLNVIPALWIYSFLFAIAPVAGWSRFTTEGIGTSCSVDWQSSDANAVSYTVFIFLGCFVAPIGVILFSYCNVYRAIREMTGHANNTWGNTSQNAKETARSEVKIAALLLAMITAFLLAWTPYAVVSLISACGRSRWIGPVAASVPAYLAKSSNLYNPILYFLMYKRFRDKLFHVSLRKCTQCRRATGVNPLQPHIVVPHSQRIPGPVPRNSFFQHKNWQTTAPSILFL